jgi:hypothetical protein
MAVALRDIRRLDDAVDVHERALAAFQGIGDRYGEAESHTEFALTLQAASLNSEARHASKRASEVLRRLVLATRSSERQDRGSTISHNSFSTACEDSESTMPVAISHLHTDHARKAETLNPVAAHQCIHRWRNRKSTT